MPPLLRRLGGLHVCAGHYLRGTGGELDIGSGKAELGRLSEPSIGIDRFSSLNISIAGKQETPPPRLKGPSAVAIELTRLPLASSSVGMEEEEEKGRRRRRRRKGRKHNRPIPGNEGLGAGEDGMFGGLEE